MDKIQLKNFIEDFLSNSGYNQVHPDVAINENVADLQIFSPPLLGVAGADDPGFLDLKRDGIVGPHLLLPEEWLSGARSVISFFLPFTETVRRANRVDPTEPSPEWLHARIEGQECINRLMAFLVACIEEEGEKALAPSIDCRFASCTEENKVFLDEEGKPLPVSFTSNWSERHAAYVCGLGSFGLSKGFITEKGIAGRFGSVITSGFLEPDNVIPSSIYERCTLCGACVRNCPVGAITIEGGKDHVRCAEYLDKMKKKYSPRYGCGKCQVNVPYECGVPGPAGG
ncbi:MAG: epoxyqueuosine reductase [Synergistaceae bacterium]|nr:epoxyqueuosine reductase [Synergistaceae bacterium]